MNDKLLQTENDGGSFPWALRHWGVTEAVITYGTLHSSL